MCLWKTPAILIPAFVYACLGGLQWGLQWGFFHAQLTVSTPGIISTTVLCGFNELFNDCIQNRIFYNFTSSACTRTTPCMQYIPLLLEEKCRISFVQHPMNSMLLSKCFCIYTLFCLLVHPNLFKFQNGKPLFLFRKMSL